MGVLTASLFQHTNFAQTTLAEAIADADVRIPIVAGEAFPNTTSDGGRFTVVISDGVFAPEIIHVITRASGSNTFRNVLRGQNGTVAVAWAAGALVTHAITAGLVDAIIGDLGSLNEDTALIPGGFENPGAQRISGGQLRYNGGFIIVETQNGTATDNLDTLIAALNNSPRAPRDGDICIIKILSESKVVTVRHLQNGGVSDFDLPEGLDLEMNALEQTLWLYRSGNNWKRLALTGSENWHEVDAAGEPAFINSWAAVGGTTVEFLKDSEGFVSLRGLVEHTSTPGASAVFLMPVGYRPATSVSFPVYKPLTTKSIDSITVLGTTGDVVWNNVSLDADSTVRLDIGSVRFLAEL